MAVDENNTESEKEALKRQEIDVLDEIFRRVSVILADDRSNSMAASEGPGSITDEALVQGGIAFHEAVVTLLQSDALETLASRLSKLKFSEKAVGEVCHEVKSLRNHFFYTSLSTRHEVPGAHLQALAETSTVTGSIADPYMATKTDIPRG